MPPVRQTPAAHRPSSGNGSCRSTTWLSYGQGPCRGRRRRRITWGQDGTSCSLGWQNPNEENQLANRGKTGVFWVCWMILECQKMILEIWDDVGHFGDFGWIGWFRRRFSLICPIFPKSAAILRKSISYPKRQAQQRPGPPQTFRTQLLPRPNRFTEISFRKIRTLEKAARRPGWPLGLGLLGWTCPLDIVSNHLCWMLMT